MEKHVFFLSKICLNRPRDKEPCAALLLGVVGGDGDLRRWGFLLLGVTVVDTLPLKNDISLTIHVCYIFLHLPSFTIKNNQM